MSVPLGNTANRFTGIREFSQVTNSYGGFLQSAGATPYNLTLPFLPDRFDWYNGTKAGDTTAGAISGVWFRGMAAGDAIVSVQTITTNVLTAAVETTNGITDATVPGGFYNEHVAIALVSATTPGVVTTSSNHYLSDNDRVVITKTAGTGSFALNNYVYVVRVLSATTFALYDTFGAPITVGTITNATGQVTKIGPALGNPAQPVSPAYPHKAIIDYPPLVQLTLGTAVMGDNDDIIYFTAWQFNNYVNRGDVA